MKHYLKQAMAVASLLLFLGVGVGLVVLQARGGKFLSIQSGSMEPGISKGDMVVVTRVPASQLALGDIVTFTNPENAKQTITHRIVELSDNDKGTKKLMTKGDANPTVDGQLSSDMVRGRVVGTVPLLGFGLDFIRNPFGLLLLIYVPALVVIVGEVRKLMAYYRTQEPYRAPEFLARRAAKKGKRPEPAVLAVITFVFALVCAPSVQALLGSDVVLTGNSISMADSVPQVQSGATFQHAYLACPDPTTTQTNFQIIVQNRARVATNLSGWYFKDGLNHTLYTFPSPTQLPRLSPHTVQASAPNVDPKSPVSLYTAAGQLVGTETWRPMGNQVCTRDL